MPGMHPLLKYKEAVTITVWYGVVMFTSMILQTLSWTDTDEIKRWVTSITVIILYTSFGLVADVFIGRYRSVTFGLWGLWIATLIVTFFFSFITGEYSFPEWFSAILAVGSTVIIFIGPSAFQVTALQFGTDQLQDRPNEDLSSFIFWYFWMEMFVDTVLEFSLDCASSRYETVTANYILLGCLVLSVLLLSLILATKICFMSNWFLRDPCALTISSRKPKNSLENPYSLIYHVLKYAKNHKYPVGRSALTYWENKIPSRIDLGKHKYGGPFTIDEVENVKTFFRLVKLLGSLVGVFIALISIEMDVWSALIPHFTNGHLNAAQVNLIQLLCGIVMVIFLLPLYKLFVYPHFQKYIPSMLKDIWIGAMLATVCAGSILLIDAIGHAVSDAPVVPCFLSNSATDVKLNLNPYLVLIPFTLYKFSYIIFTISLFEFIIAQSPHSMKGLLIGLYYSIRFGIGGCFTTINHYAFNFSTNGHLISCGTANYIMITAISLLSLVLFTIVARQYRLRERDEVVNVHLFAEEYYTKF